MLLMLTVPHLLPFFTVPSDLIIHVYFSVSSGLSC